MAAIEDQLPAGFVEEAVRARSAGALPQADGLTAPYWAAGANGELRLHRCGRCGYWNHPPKPRCRRCGARELIWERLVPPFVLYSFGVAAAPLWVPAVVSHADQPDLRLFAEVVDCDLAQLRIGALLDVGFRPIAERHGTPIHLPVFRLR